MFKKVISAALALMMVFAVAVIAFAADDAPVSPAPATTISFDTKTAGWENFGYVGFHIWAIDDPEFTGYEWGAKKQRGTDAGDGIWTYDPAEKDLILKPDCQYAVIIYTDKGAQTYNLLFDTTCLGDVAYADQTKLLENPEDSGKTTLPAYWQHQDPADNGPELKITSIGNVVGECIPRSKTVEEMFADFLVNGTLDNVREFTDVSDQEIIDHVCEGLGIGANMARSIIDTSDVDVDWSYDASPLVKEPLDGAPTEVPYTVDVTFGAGTASGDKDILLINSTVSPEYAYDTVTLTATPAAGWHFDSWSITGYYELEEGYSLSDAVITLKARSSIAAHAHFLRDELVPGDSTMVLYTVSAATDGGKAFGDKDVLTICYSLPPEYQYDTVTLTAVADEGWTFSRWEITGEYALDEGFALTDPVITVKAHDSIAAVATFEQAIAPTGIRGDADGDGKVTILDATRIQRYVAGLINESALDMIAADADGDGQVTILDATRIQRVIAELCDMDGNPINGEPVEGEIPTQAGGENPTSGGSEYELPPL